MDSLLFAFFLSRTTVGEGVYQEHKIPKHVEICFSSKAVAERIREPSDNHPQDLVEGNKHQLCRYQSPAGMYATDMEADDFHHTTKQNVRRKSQIRASVGVTSYQRD